MKWMPCRISLGLILLAIWCCSFVSQRNDAFAGNGPSKAKVNTQSISTPDNLEDPSDPLRVGDQVIPDNFAGGYGTVVGINFEKALFTIQGSNDRKYYRYGIKELALKKGILSNVSVGDQVIPDNFVAGYGTVVGINFEKELFVIQGSNDRKYYRFSYDCLFLTAEGCNRLQLTGANKIRQKEESPRLTESGKEMKSSSIQEEQPCAICLNGEKKYALIPCGHLVYCSNCAPKNNFPAECPICRSAVEKINRIYK